MKCSRCGTDNKNSVKFCPQCGNALGQQKPGNSPKVMNTHSGVMPADAATEFWRPDWKWHVKTLAIIFVVLVVIYFVLSQFLAKVPKPHRMRDIPPEMTPWLKK